MPNNPSSGSANSGARTKPESVRLINSYNPTKSKVPLIKTEQWVRVGDFVREVMLPMAFLAPVTLRPFLTAATRLAVWADNQGLPLDKEYLLDPEILVSFEVAQEQGVANVIEYLHRLGISNCVTAAAAQIGVGIARLDYQRPYEAHELETLVRFARTHSNEHRRATLQAIVALGAGAGVVRSRMRGVKASCVHLHDDGATYVRTSTNCARVREDFVSLLSDTCARRPEGQLVGTENGPDLTSAAVSWVQGRVGVPELSVDRLRATYICRLIEEGCSLRHLICWTGINTTEALMGYLAYTAPLAKYCADK